MSAISTAGGEIFECYNGVGLVLRGGDKSMVFSGCVGVVQTLDFIPPDSKILSNHEVEKIDPTIQLALKFGRLIITGVGRVAF